MNILKEKGGMQKRGENSQLLVLASKKEGESFVKCGNHIGKDNILFFNDINTASNDIFLLLHGSPLGKVLFNDKLLSLEEVYHELLSEDVLNSLVSILNIKHIYTLCCYGGYLTSYEENGLTIEPYFNNKGKVIGTFNPLFPNMYCLETEEVKVA